MEKKNHLDFVTAICTGAIGLYSLLDSRNINDQYYARPQHSDFLTSPALMPMILGIALILFSVILLVRSLKGMGIGEMMGSIRSAVGRFFHSRLVLFTAIGLAWMGIYVYVLLRFLPFAIASFIFLVVLMLMLRTAKWWKILLISLITVVAIVLLFQVGFHVRLP